MTRILLISGSVSDPSINTETLTQFAALAEEAGYEAGFLRTRLIDMPFYSLQGEGQGGHPTVDSFRQEVSAADAVVFATPQHNGRFPAVLQNALDWSTRLEHRSLWAGKRVGVISVSPGPRKAALANETLRASLAGPFKADVVEPHVEIGKFEELQAAGGVFADPQLRADALAMLEALTR